MTQYHVACVKFHIDYAGQHSNAILKLAHLLQGGQEGEYVSEYPYLIQKYQFATKYQASEFNLIVSCIEGVKVLVAV